MDYQQTLDYLYGQLPMFSRMGAAAMTKDLSNTLALCELLDQPQQKFKAVHVGGTNGKGSTSHMLASILQTAGYKTGLYTSPHLKDFRERIRINGEMISEKTVIGFVEKHRPDFERIKPSFFEMTVGLAFDAFADAGVDVAVIEVGLGGRLDSTNVITPILSVITNIGWDHMNLLGDTLPLIAKEKAGIIKPGVPVVIGEYQPEVADIFIEKARQEHSELVFASDRYSCEVLVNNSLSGGPLDVAVFKKTDQHSSFSTSEFTIQLDLTGAYQRKNLATVLTAADELRRLDFLIDNNHIRQGLSQVRSFTGLNGRWQVLNHAPLTICDTGHNPEGIVEVLKNIVTTPHTLLHFVLGMVNDKDISKILSMLPKGAVYYFCCPAIPRGLSAKELKSQAANFNLKGQDYPSVVAAKKAAEKAAQPGDLVFIGGSTFVVAEVV